MLAFYTFYKSGGTIRSLIWSREVRAERELSKNLSQIALCHLLTTTNFDMGKKLDNTTEPQHDAKLPVGGSVLEQIRQAFADYRRSEGCSCCRDMDAHEEAEKRLAELLKPEPYEDGSGWDWSKYCTDR